MGLMYAIPMRVIICLISKLSGKSRDQLRVGQPRQTSI